MTAHLGRHRGPPYAFGRRLRAQCRAPHSLVRENHVKRSLQVLDRVLELGCALGRRSAVLVVHVRRRRLLHLRVAHARRVSGRRATRCRQQSAGASTRSTIWRQRLRPYDRIEGARRRSEKLIGIRRSVLRLGSAAVRAALRPSPVAVRPSRPQCGTAVRKRKTAVRFACTAVRFAKTAVRKCGSAVRNGTKASATATQERSGRRCGCHCVPVT